MPKGKGYGNPHPRTKAGKKRKVEKVMSEFKAGTLRSGSGKKVTSRSQAIAIAMSESGQARNKPVKAGLNPKQTATSIAKQRAAKRASEARKKAQMVAERARKRQAR